MPETNIFFTSAVSENDNLMRLDKFLLQQMPDLSRAQIQKLVAGSCVCLDGEPVLDNAFKVKTGNVFEVAIPEPEETEIVPENIALDIVYEDDDLIVVNKPAGMVVHPGAGVCSGTLVNALLYHCQDNLSAVGGVKRPGIVHRIDKDTSGLLVAAKNDLAHRGLSEQFAVHSTERTYFAVVYGVPQQMTGRIEGNIARSKFDRKKMAMVKTAGKEAVTNYKVLKIFKNVFSLVQCNLETGRTHQIRVHLSSIGCNLVGDKVYVKAHKSHIKGVDNSILKAVNEFPRQALHAATLGFVHPRTGKLLHFSVPMPEDMDKLVNMLVKNL